MAGQKFYNVKKRESVTIPEDKCTKVIYKRKTSSGIQERYAVRSKDNDGTNLTKFINKKVFDALKCPISK
jgi:hypothetical protein